MANNSPAIITPFSEIKNPGKKIKDWYGLPFVRILSRELDIKNTTGFIDSFKAEYRSLELKERLSLIADLLDQHITGTYKRKLSVLKVLFGPEWPSETGMLSYGFHLYPISQFAEKFAVRDIHATAAFARELTKRFTAEFIMRPIANHDPVAALSYSKEWSKDKNFHVRRLASEGIRVRLPWGAPVAWIKDRPEKTLPVLSSLRNDPSLYVRRSVANALGDIIKVNEKLALQTIDSWLCKKPTTNTLWVISHAIRHPVKKKKGNFLELKERLRSLSKAA